MTYLSSRFALGALTEEDVDAIRETLIEYQRELHYSEDVEPPSVFGEFLLKSAEQLAEEEANEETPKSNKTKYALFRIGKQVARWGFALVSRIAIWAMNIVRTTIYHLSRILWSIIVRPLITSLIGFLATPPGWIALGIAGGALVGYYLYQYFDGRNTGQPPEAGVEPLEEPQEHGDELFLSPVYTRTFNKDDAQSDAELMAEFQEMERSEGGSGGTGGGFFTPRVNQPAMDSSRFSTQRPMPRWSADQMRKRTRTAMDYPRSTSKGKLNEGSLFKAMASANMTNIYERAMFLAQMSHESGGFKYSEEIWGPTARQRRYEGRRDLGNVQPGDGYRFRGRGFIQLTGRYNYEAASKYIGIDLVSNPDLAADSDIAAQVALWYWYSARPKIQRYAQAQNIVMVTKYINGGSIGLADRRDRYRYYLRKLSMDPSYGSEYLAPPEPEVIDPPEVPAEPTNLPPLRGPLVSTPTSQPKAQEYFLFNKQPVLVGG